MLVRADSAYYGYDIVAAARRAGARFSVTARLTPTVVKAIASIDEQAWTPIRYPNAIYDEDEQRWISDAEVAEIAFTAFTSRRKAEHVTARLIVRRVRRLNPAHVPAGSRASCSRSTATTRCSPTAREPMLAAEATHRDHAIVEQVIAELKNGPLAHLPSGVFAANAAWLACAAIAHNLTRAAGTLAGGRHARTRTAHHPRPADQHPGPDRALRAPPGPAPTPGLALGARPGRAVPPRPARPPPRRRLTTRPHGPDRRPSVETPGRPAAHPRQPATQPKQDQPASTAKINGGSRFRTA